MSEPKVVSSSTYVPGDGLFKAGVSERAHRVTVTCGHTETCGVFKRGQCLMTGVFIQRCPFGALSRVEGPTRRSKNFRGWVAEQLQKQPNVPCGMSSEQIAVIGDLVYLPYSYFTGTENKLIPLNHFTADWIARRCEHTLRNFWGDEIPSYRLKTVPQFIRHLAHEMPDLLDEVCAISAHVRAIREGITNIGRIAQVKTLVPNVGTVKSPYSGDSEWIWDGEYLTSKTAPLTSVSGLEGCGEVRVKPSDTTVVKVTSDAQVSANTVFTK